MNNLLGDFRFALRQLFKSPSFALTAIISLALGIGATTAVFSVIYAIVVNPYPYANSDRMVHLMLTDRSGQDQFFGLTGGQYREIKQSPVVEDAFTTETWNLTVTGGDIPEDLNGAKVSSNLFTFMGVPMALGRGIQPSDALDGQDPEAVVVLGYKFWQKHFLGNPAVIGQQLQMVRHNYTIVGVASARFTWNDADAYIPMKITQDLNRTDGVEVRLKPGVTHQAADAALTPLIEQFAKQTPRHFPADKFAFHVRGLNDAFMHDLGGSLWLLFIAVALLLAIGCGNVSILLLARGTARQQEFAVRSAIGATRTRLIRQLLTESVLLSVTGAALGVLLAFTFLKTMIELLPKYSFPHEAAIQINVPVLIFSVLIALITGILFGLWPALQLSRPEVNQAIQSGSRRIAGGGRGRLTNNVLIAAQLALTWVMLAGAGAAMEGFVSLLHQRLGYDPHNVMSVGIPIHENTYNTWAERRTYFEQMLEKTASVPGVSQLAISTNATPPTNGNSSNIEILGKAGVQSEKVGLNFVSPNYFAVLRVPLVQGRVWDSVENHNAAHLAVINETMARRFFSNGNAIGQSFRPPDLKGEPPFALTGEDPSGWYQIIGIIADKRDNGLIKPIEPEAFIPFSAFMPMYTQILVRSQTSPLRLIHAIGVEINTLDADQQVSGQIEDLDNWVSDELVYQREHLISWLFGAFAVLALVLAAVGLYSVVSYSVVQRTNEFGIRMALGAPRSHIWEIVFGSMTLSVGAGILSGVALTLALNQVLAHWAEGSARDPLVLLAVTALLVFVAAAACAGPAHRASTVDPMSALRFE
jgi:putative ABC transport system permease protein